MVSNNSYPAEKYARLINSLYYREFDEDFAESVIEDTKLVDIKGIAVRSPEEFFEIASVPYKMELNLEHYRALGPRDGDQVPVDETIQKASMAGAAIYRIIKDKLTTSA